MPWLYLARRRRLEGAWNAKGRTAVDPRREHELLLTRRQLFGRAAAGIGTAALTSLLSPEVFAAAAGGTGGHSVLGKPHFTPTAKRVIYLFQSGGPSHIDLFDHKPKLKEQ